MLHCIGILLCAPGVCPTVQVVVYPSASPFLLAPFQNLRVVVSQLVPECSGVQPEVTCNLRNVVFDISDVVAGRYGVPVLEVRGGSLPPRLPESGRVSVPVWYFSPAPGLVSPQASAVCPA